MRKQLFYWLMPVVMGFAMVACEKEKEDDGELVAASKTGAEVTMVDNMTGVMSDMINGFSKGAENASQKSVSTSYPIITIKPFSGTALYPATVTVDFGPTPIEVITENGSVALVSGKVTITKSAPFFIKGSQQDAGFENFTINGYGVEGFIKWTTHGKIGANDTWVFNRVVSLKFTGDKGWQHEYVSDFDFGFIAGFEDIIPGNAAIEVTGTASGKSSWGENYIHEINDDKPVLFVEGCRWAVKGEMLITNNSGSYIIDLGDGSCDNLATIRREDGVGGEFTFKMK